MKTIVPEQDKKVNPTAASADHESAAKSRAGEQTPSMPQTILRWQQQAGNRAVQRWLAQRQSAEGFELDEETARRINQARGRGQPLDEDVQTQMESRLGYDFSQVRVHTSPEADSLNHTLQAKAFTTGQDVFFRAGEYQPHTDSGKELIAHELTHVVQQSTGQVPASGSGMTVRPADDPFEREADAVARQSAGIAGHPDHAPAEAIQRQTEEEEEDEE